MNDSRDNLSTADLAGQTPGRTQPDGYDEPDQPETDRPDPDLSAGSDGVAGNMTGPAGDAAHDDPTRTDYDRDTAGVTRDTTGSTRADYDRDTAGTSPVTTGSTRADYDRDTAGPTGTDVDRDPSSPIGTDYDRDTDGPDRRATGDAGMDAIDDRRNDTGPGPVRTDVAPATASTMDTPGTASTMDTPGTASTMDTPGTASTMDTPGTASTVDTPGTASTMDTPGTGSTMESTTGPLLGSADSEGFRARWTGVQTGFVDAPREAVQKADALVAELMQHLAGTFADERGKLEHQWDRGDDVPTDDLRDAFQRYRSFFERLLST